VVVAQDRARDAQDHRAVSLNERCERGFTACAAILAKPTE
jgi:hypothetical protein